MRALMLAPMLTFPSIGKRTLGIALTGVLESALHGFSVQPGGGNSVGVQGALAGPLLSVILPASSAHRTVPMVALRRN